MKFKKKHIVKYKKNVNSIRTVYNNVEYASMLEVCAAQLLDENKISFEYEKPFTLIEPFKYSGFSFEPVQYKKKYTFKDNSRLLSLSYKPDFIGIVDGKIRWVIECKGRQNERFPIVWKLFKLYLNTLDPPPLLMLPKNQDHIEKCISLILKIDDSI